MLNNEYHLLIDTQGYAVELPCKRFRLHGTSVSESIVKTNKIIKENDVLEYLKTKLKRKDIELV